MCWSLNTYVKGVILFEEWNLKLGDKGFMLHFIRKIDSGRFGKVVLVGGSAGGQFAVKLFRQQHDQPGRVSTSAQLEVANFNSFSHRIQDIGRAEVVDLTDIQGLTAGDLDNYCLEAMLMPLFQNEREVRYEEIQPYLANLAERNFFMGDPKADNFFYTTEFGLMPIDFGLVFAGDSPLLMGVYLSAVINAPFQYSNAFENPYMGETGRRYQGLREGRESGLVGGRESRLFFDNEATVALALVPSGSTPELEVIQEVQEKSESNGPCCAVL
ncbi:hypothetical protein [Piscirickettsia salmonis]|nr:hypothetical protein [Piscirickettsia salmonis]